jgi:hypothetical protein
MSLRTNAAAALCLSLLGLAAPAGAIGATGVTAGTVSITFDHPADALDHIWFVYDWGDINRAFPVAGTAAAGVSTTLALSLPIGLPASPYGSPGFGVLATYGGKPSGVYAALSPGVAASLVSGSVPFGTAFPGFAACTEGDLVAALVGSSSCGGLPATAIVSSFGADAYYLGNPTGATGTGQLAAYTGAGDPASFVRFSNASAGGAVSVRFAAAQVPEPAAGCLLAVGGLALAQWRRRAAALAGSACAHRPG